jgi:hypothetical protein
MKVPFLEKSGQSMKLNTYLHLVLRLRMQGAVTPLFSLYTFILNIIFKTQVKETN